MADVTLFAHKVARVEISPMVGKSEDTAVVMIHEQGGGLTSLFVSGWDPASVGRARSIASAILTATELVIDAKRKAAAVPIEDLAPDPVNEADKESVRPWKEDELEERRRLGPRPAYAPPNSAA